MCLYDSEFNLVKGEHHETNFTDKTKTPIDIPPILTSENEWSKGFLRGLYNDNMTSIDIILSSNKHPMLVYIGPIKYESNETVVGYVVVGTDFVSVINNLIHGKYKYKYKYNCHFYFYFIFILFFNIFNLFLI